MRSRDSHFSQAVDRERECDGHSAIGRKATLFPTSDLWLKVFQYLIFNNAGLELDN